MSWEATSWALREAPAPTPTARLVLIALADRCGRDGRSAWPTIQVLAQEAHTSESTVWRSLKSMEQDGIISRGDQSLARHDEHGRYLPMQYRPTVWVLNMGVTLEHVAQKPGKQARAERAERAARLAQGTSVVKMQGLENADIATDSRPCNLQSLNDGLCADAQSRLCTDAYQYKETNSITNTPTTFGSVPHHESEMQQAEKICTHLRDSRKAMRLSAPEPTPRDLRAVVKLLDLVPTGENRVRYLTELVDFALQRDFFARTVRTGSNFAKRFESIRDDRTLDARRETQCDSRSSSSAQSAPHVHDAACEHVRKIVDSSTFLRSIAPDSVLRHSYDAQVAVWLNSGTTPVEVVAKLSDLLSGNEVVA